MWCDMKIEQPGQYVDQLIRQTRGHHVELSAMADLKANMMLTVASLVIPLSVGHLQDPRLKWASTIAIAFCVLTVILAAYATMPKLRLPSADGIPPDAQSPLFNILFFGDFVGMTYEDFKREMERIMNDHSRTYEVQIREVYNMGIYLAMKKYRYVRLAYLTFITGLVLSGCALIWGSFVVEIQ